MIDGAVIDGSLIGSFTHGDVARKLEDEMLS